MDRKRWCGCMLLLVEVREQRCLSYWNSSWFNGAVTIMSIELISLVESLGLRDLPFVWSEYTFFEIGWVVSVARRIGSCLKIIILVHLRELFNNRF